MNDMTGSTIKSLRSQDAQFVCQITLLIDNNEMVKICQFSCGKVFLLLEKQQETETSNANKHAINKLQNISSEPTKIKKRGCRGEET